MKRKTQADDLLDRAIAECREHPADHEKLGADARNLVLRAALDPDSRVSQRRLASLFVPRGLTVENQLKLVFDEYGLERGAPRCMKCGGELAKVSKDSVRDEAPPRTFRWLDDFYRCTRCRQLFWEGTHWKRIERKLDALLPE